MQDKTWYSILGLDAEPLFLQDHMLKIFSLLLGQWSFNKKFAFEIFWPLKLRQTMKLKMWMIMVIRILVRFYTVTIFEDTFHLKKTFLFSARLSNCLTFVKYIFILRTKLDLRNPIFRFLNQMMWFADATYLKETKGNS